MMEKHNWCKKWTKNENYGVILSTVEYGVIIQKSIINIALKMKLKIMLKKLVKIVQNLIQKDHHILDYGQKISK